MHAYEKPTARFSLEHSIFLKTPTNGKQIGKKSPDLPFVGNSAQTTSIDILLVVLIHLIIL